MRELNRSESMLYTIYCKRSSYLKIQSWLSLIRTLKQDTRYTETNESLAQIVNFCKTLKYIIAYSLYLCMHGIKQVIWQFGFSYHGFCLWLTLYFFKHQKEVMCGKVFKQNTQIFFELYFLIGDCSDICMYEVYAIIQEIKTLKSILSVIDNIQLAMVSHW